MRSKWGTVTNVSAQGTVVYNGLIEPSSADTSDWPSSSSIGFFSLEGGDDRKPFFHRALTN